MRTEDQYRAYRAALRTRVHELILRLEARGVTFRLTEAGRVQASPADAITADELATLRAHRDAVRLLIAHRADWCEWPLPGEPFDPARAFGPTSEAVH